MKRIHSIEFHEQPWFPTVWRDHTTNFLTFLSVRTSLYGPMVPIVAKLAKESGSTHILDLCSGAGGPSLWMRDQIAERESLELTLVLSDLYPNEVAWSAITRKHPHVTSHSAPVDVLDVPRELEGIRTMFAAFHHFIPEQATRILQDAVDKNRPIVIIEGTQRTFVWMLAISMSWLNFMLITPFLKPRRLFAWIFTYIIPILPFVVLWDGLVSCTRTYTVEEMRAMCASLEGSERYIWEVGAAGKEGSLAKVLYLTGRPAS